MLIALAAPVGDALAAEEGDVTLDAGGHDALGKLAIFLVVALAVENGGLQAFQRKIRSYGRQAFIGDGCDDHVASGTVKGLSQADIVDMIVFHSSGEEFRHDFREGDRACQSCTCHFGNNFGIHKWRLLQAARGLTIAVYVPITPSDIRS